MTDEPIGVAYDLGYPVEHSFGRYWAINVIVGVDRVSQLPLMTPVMFTESQAREIARRINAYFGEHTT